VYTTRLSLATRCDTISAMGCAYAQLKHIEVYTTLVWEDKMEDEILNGTFYEWDMEYCTEYGDIDRHDHAMKLEELKHTQSGVDTNGMWSRLVLMRTVYKDGDMKDQSLAYVNNGQLPLTTDGGAKVPQKYHKEFNKHIEWAGKLGDDQVPWQKNLDDYYATKTNKGS